MIDFLESIMPVWIVSAFLMVSVLLVGIGYFIRAVQDNIVISVLKRRCDRVEAENRAIEKRLNDLGICQQCKKPLGQCRWGKSRHDEHGLLLPVFYGDRK